MCRHDRGHSIEQGTIAHEGYGAAQDRAAADDALRCFGDALVTHGSLTAVDLTLNAIGDQAAECLLGVKARREALGLPALGALRVDSTVGQEVDPSNADDLYGKLIAAGTKKKGGKKGKKGGNKKKKK